MTKIHDNTNGMPWYQPTPWPGTPGGMQGTGNAFPSPPMPGTVPTGGMPGMNPDPASTNDAWNAFFNASWNAVANGGTPVGAPTTGGTGEIHKGVLSLLANEGAVGVRLAPRTKPVGEEVKETQQAQELKLGMERTQDTIGGAANVQTPGGYNIRFSEKGQEFSVTQGDQAFFFRLERDPSTQELKLHTHADIILDLPGAVVLGDGTKLNFGVFHDAKGNEQCHVAIMNEEAYTKVEGGRASGSSFDSMNETLRHLHGYVENPEKELANVERGNSFQEFRQNAEAHLKEKGYDWVLGKIAVSAADLDRMYPEGSTDNNGLLTNRYLEVSKDGLTPYQSYQQMGSQEFTVVKDNQTTVYQVTYENNTPVLYRNGERIADDLRKMELSKIHDALFDDAAGSRAMFTSFLGNMRRMSSSMNFGGW